MPRVYTQVARKDYPQQGIKKGETYYKWSIKTGPISGRTYKSKTYPKPLQLTGSEFMSTLYSIEEDLGGLSVDSEGTYAEKIEGVKDYIDEIIGQLEDLRSETQGKLDNMPEGLQQGGTGELLQERIDAV